MRVHHAIIALVAFASCGLSQIDTPTTADYTESEILNGTALADLADIANSNLDRTLSLNKRSSTCSLKTAKARLEWRAMPKPMRKSYTDAVTCLQKLPPQVMTTEQSLLYPGVKSRFDEYLATHINYTLQIHFTADFLAWHRFYIHSYEQDLKKCGYTGNLPYWNWPTDALVPEKSSLFNGDANSLGSNGAYIPGRESVYLANQDVTAPPGTGGGCIYKGPFSDTSVNLGPVDTANVTGVLGPYDYNPHCIVRDLNGWFSSRFNTWKNVTELILESEDIATFQGVMQADSTYVPAGSFGVHGGGHFTAGATGTLSDFYSSPGDPLFYLHHAMIDRVWTIWQFLDLPDRRDAISGTSTILNLPPSAEMTLDDMIPFGLVAPDQRLGDLMSTTAGPFCYHYL